jgi:magnesium transporter
MRNATGEEDAEDLGAPAIGLEPTSPVVTRRLDPAEVKRRRSVVGNIRLGSSDDDRSEHESEEEHDRESDRGSVRDRPGGSDGRSGRETTSTHSTASLRSDHRTLDLKFLAKWQDANLKSHSTGAKKEENGRIPPYRAGTNTSLTNSSAYEMATTPPQTDRFTLYSPSLTEPMPSSTFNFAPSLLSSQPWFWIDVLDPTDSEMLMFSRVFHLHPLTSEDIIEGRIRRDGFGQVGSEGREKLELYPGYSFVLVRALDPKGDETGVDADEIEGVNLNIVVSMNSGKEGRVPWILSFHSRPLHAPQQVRARHTMLQKYDMSAGVDWICYALLDAVVDSFMPETRSTEMEAESIEDLVLMLRKESQEELLRRINESKRRVTGLMKLLQGKPATIKSMRRRLLAHYTDLGISELALYLSDVGDNVVGMQSNLQFQDQTLARAHGTYLARVQIEIQGSTASSNDMTNKVTLLASIIVPLHLLTGMWGEFGLGVRWTEST